VFFFFLMNGCCLGVGKRDDGAYELGERGNGNGEDKGLGRKKVEVRNDTPMSSDVVQRSEHSVP